MSINFTPEQEEQVRVREDKAVAGVLKMLKKHYGEEVYHVLMKELGERARLRYSKIAEESGDISIETFIKHQWESLPVQDFEYTIEETESGYQIICTKCAPAEMAKLNDITELMFYACCGTDPFNVEGFNPNIGFKRTKTLMQGDDCCDHFYYYKDKKR
jgi:predicted ArsR family transcriptional regulator